MIKPIGPEYATFIASSQTMYPEAMREEVDVFSRLLSHGYCYGCFGNYTLMGWALTEPDDPKHIAGNHRQVYWYDLAVLEEYQGQGIAKALMKHAYAELRWQGFWIRMHTRRATYPRNDEGIRRCGYQIVTDLYLPNHYGLEYEMDEIEHGHELLLKPVCA